MGGFVGSLFGAAAGQTDNGVAKPGFDPNQYANNGQQAQTEQQQQQFINALQAQMGGHGAVQQLIQNQSQQNQAMALGQAAATRGANPGLALRNALNANATMQQQANQAGVQAELGTQGQLGGAISGMRQQDLSNSNMYNQLGAQYAGLQTGVEQQNAANKQKTIGGVLGGVGGVLGLAQGGVVPAMKYAEGGPVSNAAQYLMGMGGGNSLDVGLGSYKPVFTGFQGDNSDDKTGGLMGKVLGKGAKSAFGGSGNSGLMAGAGEDAGAESGLASSAVMVAARGGKVPAMVSPGERYLSPKEAQDVAQGKKSAMSAGQKIPGKPKVGGDKDSYDNDTVPKKLDAGGVVVPRSVTQSPEARKKADAFVKAVLSHKGK